MISAIVTVLGALALAPAVASAAIAGSTVVSMPLSVTVGQTGVVAQITVTNTNSDPDDGAANDITSVSLLPACSLLSGPACFPGDEDPGVFTSAATAMGTTGCAGKVFDVATNPTTGELTLTPQTTVTLPNAGASCVIEVTLSVVGMPAADSAAEADGVQTEQVASSTQFSASQPAVSSGTSETTVNKATPAIATTASAGITLGSGTLTDSATVSGRVNPGPGATVTFSLFGPDGVPCQPPAAFTSTVPIAGDGTATSAAFSPTQPGTYRWIASYDGDTNNNTVNNACGDPGETVTVTAPPPPPPPPATPTVTVAASPGTALGVPVTATATVTGRANPAAPSVVDFRLYGPDVIACVTTPVTTLSVPVGASGVATSPAYAPPQPGVYRWVASIRATADTAAASSSCEDPAAHVTIAPLPPKVLSAGFATQPRAGQFATLVIAAYDPTQPISGLQVQFGEPRGLSGISACRLIPFGIAVSPLRLQLPYRFRVPGVHKITIFILSGGCSSKLRRTTSTLTVTVLSATAPRRAGFAAARSVARSAASARAAAAKCSNTFMTPTSNAVRRLKVATAILCLVNIERAKLGLGKLKRSRVLAQAATGHSKDMLKRRFFEHAGPGGPSFQQRLNRIRYRGSSAAENIGYGSNFNAKLMVQAWMNSPPHKANILSPRSNFAGIGIAVGIPVFPLRPGSTYTMDFGATLK